MHTESRNIVFIHRPELSMHRSPEVHCRGIADVGPVTVGACRDKRRHGRTTYAVHFRYLVPEGHSLVAQGFGMPDDHHLASVKANIPAANIIKLAIDDSGADDQRDRN